MAHVYATREVMPLMEERGGGHVVITASAAGLLMMMQSAPYTVTKHAAVSFAEWLAVNHGDRGIGVHCLCPQGVRTPMVAADPSAEAEVAASGAILEPSFVAEKVVEAVRSGTFLDPAPSRGARLRDGQGRRPGPLAGPDAQAAGPLARPDRRRRPRGR